MNPEGKIEYYDSEMDGLSRPYAVSETGPSAGKRPLLVEVSPGGTNLERAVQTVEEMAGIAVRHGEPCIVIRPTGRGPGSVYQNYGEVDTFEAIADAVSKFGVDEDRICVTGASMGGAATWYLIAHNPDFFASGAPFCGYCDYRLWEKPGGLTFPMREWEEPSWRARSAAFLIENFEHTPVWIVHGEWDRSVGGGVPVEHSRQMVRLLEEKGFPVKYTEVPQTGHGCRKPEIWEEVILWLLQQRKKRRPDHFALTTYELRHNHAYGVRIDQLLHYGAERALIRFSRRGGGEVEVETGNVQRFSLSASDFGEIEALQVDGQALVPKENADDNYLHFQCDESGLWREGPFDLSGEKRHESSGPIGDLFHAQTILVPGTTGSLEETHHLANFAKNTVKFFRGRNGGVHRGGIMGENNVELPIVADAELKEEERRKNNLILLGTPSSNAVLNRFQDQLPISFQKDSLAWGGKIFKGEKAALLAVFPHPENPSRAIAVYGGASPDAITWGSHFDLLLLPDYIAHSGGELLDWGFFNNKWEPQD